MSTVKHVFFFFAWVKQSYNKHGGGTANRKERKKDEGVP